MSVEKLGKQAIFSLLRPEQINRLSENSEVVKFEAGEMIYAKGGEACHSYIVLEGQVALRLPGRHGLNVLIDELGKGDMFGGCLAPGMDAYALDAQCVAESELLMLSISAVRAIMDEDPRIGYAIQATISKIYFKRYVETMRKLQNIVMNIPVEPD